MNMWISDLLTHSKIGRPWCRHRDPLALVLLVKNSSKRTMSVVWMFPLSLIHWILPLTLNDHVVQYHTTIYHLPNPIFRPGHSGVPDNSKSSLDPTKCPLHVEPSSATRWPISAKRAPPPAPSDLAVLRLVISPHPRWAKNDAVDPNTVFSLVSPVSQGCIDLNQL